MRDIVRKEHIVLVYHRPWLFYKVSENSVPYGMIIGLVKKASLPRKKAPQQGYCSNYYQRFQGYDSVRSFSVPLPRAFYKEKSRRQKQSRKYRRPQNREPPEKENNYRNYRIQYRRFSDTVIRNFHKNHPSKFICHRRSFHHHQNLSAVPR